MKKILFLIFVFSITFGLISCTGDKKITITFESNGGSEVEDMEVGTDQTSLNLPTPTKTGYTFDGWYLDEALTEPFTIGALLTNETLTLYAKWNAIILQSTITFNSNGGTTLAPITQESGTTVTSPTAPTKEGFTFGGWYLDIGLTTAYTFTTMPAEDITLYAKWNAVIVQSTITFETYGGGTIAPITADVGSSISAPSNPTKLGHTFAGWFADSGLSTTFIFTTMPATDTTLYAKWTVNSYTMSYETNGGSPVNPVQYDYLTSTSAPVSPSKEGHTFAGWYSDTSLTTSYIFTTMPAENVTLYAKWTINSYTVTFNSNGGSSVAPITQNYGTTLVSPTAPTKEGHSFAGWYSNETLTTSYTFTTIPAQNITLYAKWNINTYTITFNSNGGSLVTEITQNYHTSVATPTAPTKEGHTFDGWYSNQELTTVYTFGVMPGQNITLYAKWLINQYIITFDSNEGSIISPITQNFGTEVLAPTPPTRTGYTFDGWYTDLELTTPYVFSTMPSQSITLYAKWNLIVVYDMIGDMHFEEATAVRVRGVIYYKFPLAMNPGFYLYDGTGYIFVLGSTEYSVGQGVEFEATYSIFEFTPQLTDVTNLVLNDTFTTMPTYIDMPLETIAHANPNTATFHGQTVIINGYVEKYGMEYVLVPNFSDQEVFINYKSIQGLGDPFLSKVGTRIEIHAIIHGYSPMQNAWHILYQPSGSIVDVVLTDEEKVAEILAKGVEELDDKTFSSAQTLYIPSTDPYYSSTISWEPIGINASHVNMATGEFIDIEENLSITIRLTVTIGIASDYVDITIHVTPLETLTIAEFKLLSDMDYGTVSGVVIFASIEIGIMIIADETGILAAITNTTPNYGDLVIAGGYHQSMDGLIIMADEDGHTLLEIVSHDQNIPYSPIEMSITEYLTLNPELSSHWIQYVEITGTVYFEEANHSYYIEDESGALMILALSKEVNDLLGVYDGFEVKIRGIIFPNFDEVFVQLMFVFSGEPQEIQMAMSEEELIEEMGMMLKSHIESKTYYPGQILDLPTEHPFFDLTVSYYTNAPALFNITTFEVSPDIIEPVEITLEATITMGIYTHIVLITLQIEPLDVISIHDFKLTDGVNEYYIQGVVIYKLEDFFTSYMIADETGIIYLISTWNFDVGTEVLLYGFYDQSDVTPYIHSYTDAVIDIIAFDQMMPMTPLALSLEDFMALDIENPSHVLGYYSLKGILSKLEFDHFFMLDDGVRQVAIYAPVSEGYAALNSYLGYYVSVSGLSLPMGDMPFMMLVFLGTPGSISLGGTDQEVFTALSNQMISYYASETFAQGIFHQLPKGTPGIITYDYGLGTNGAYYNLSTGYISSDVTEELYIQINVILTVQSYSNSFYIYLHIVPVESVSISQFKLGNVDTLYTVRGVVVYQEFSGFEGGFFIFADHTDYLIVPVDLGLTDGSEYLIEAEIDTVMGVKTMKEGTITVIQLLSEHMPDPLYYTPVTIDDLIALYDPEDSENWGLPIELTGLIVDGSDGHIYFTDAYGSTSRVRINSHDYDQLSVLYDQLMFEVKLKGYLLPFMTDDIIDGFMFFSATQAMPELIYETDQEKMDALFALAEYAIQGPVSGKVYLELPDEVTLLEATLVWSQVDGVMIFDPMTKYLSDVLESTFITLRATVTIGSLTQYHDFILEVTPFVVLNIPNYENTMIEGLFPGLIIHSMDYRSHYMGGTVFNVHLEFPSPESIGADYFILEYYSDIEETWKTFIYQDEPLTTWYYNTWEERWMNGTNFSLNLPINTYYRLFAFGTPEPLYSNEVYVSNSLFHTQFTSWSMDESMYITGVMMPEYGYGLEVSASIYDHDLDIYLENALIYEWYRVNPYTYEMTLIEGADESLYITTFDDVGYYILSRIKGDGISADGFVQMISWSTVKVMNPTRLISYTTTGFVLEFSHLFDPSDLESLVIFNEYYDELIITDIISTPNPFMFEFVVDLSESSHVALQLMTYSWMMIKLGSHMHYQMIEFDLN